MTPRATGSWAPGCHGGAQGGIATAHEAGQAPFEGRPAHQDVAAAGLAAEADVGAKAVDKPRLAATRMRLPKTDDVAKQDLEHRGA